MKKLLTLLLAVMMALAAGCGGKDSATGDGKGRTDFKIGYLASTGHILYFIAQEKGFFSEEGLNTELVLFNNSGEGLTALAGRKLDVGPFGSSAPLLYMSKGSQLTIFGGQMSQGHALVAKPEKVKEYSDIKNLKGKTIATIRLATGDIVFRNAVLQAGLKINQDVIFKEMESAAAALEAVKKGMADAAVVWTPFRKTAELQGLAVVKYSSQVAGFENHPCCRQIAATAALKEHPERYVAFHRALIKAYRFYKTNREESIDILAKYVDIDKKILFEETYGGYVESNPDPARSEVIGFYQFMKEAGYIEKDFDVREHINVDIYKKALESLLKETPEDKILIGLRQEFSRNDR